MVLWARRQSQRQRRGGPSARGHRDELVLAIGKPALEIELERLAPRGHEPGPVVLLRAHQEGHPAAVRGIVRRQAAGLVQRRECGAGRVRVARQFIDLGPTSIGALGRKQLLRRGLDLLA